MKYFIIRPDKDMVKRINVVKWRAVINDRWINHHDFHLLPPRSLLEMVTMEHPVLPEIITSPFILISEMFHSVMKMYGDPFLEKDVILIDHKKNIMKRYFLVLFDIFEGRIMPDNGLEITCPNHLLTEKNVFSVLMNGRVETIISLDVAESLLQRDALGIELEAVKISLVNAKGKDDNSEGRTDCRKTI